MSNASSSANGWNFQVTVGIILFFSELHDIRNIKIEGEKEDIEILYEDGKSLYCQVKAVYDIDNAKRVALHHLKKALDSLSKSSGQADNLMYATNNINPMNVASSKVYYEHNCIYDFDELPNDDKKKILRYISESFPTNKLKIAIFSFGRDKSVRKRFAVETIDKFFKSINVNNFNQYALMDKYESLFFDDACNRYVNKTKSDFLWPAIIVALDECEDENEMEKLIGDSDDIYNIQSLYNEFINERLFDYEFVGKYITKYSEYRSFNTGGTIVDFVGKHFFDFSEDFSSIANDEARQQLAKIVIYKILKNRRTINKIKEGAGLKYDDR